ncbi:hypothetical protein [Flavobacterium sp.]|uniref:hypothetical protein n=1 Tax=Flavobacterium sp. TaxID=239 RepID=UPI004033350A
MLQSGFKSTPITQDLSELTIENVTSLTISNYGNTVLSVTIGDVTRIIPPFNPAIGVPFGSFSLPCDGTACDLRISFNFDTGIGSAILDYRKLLQPLTC